MRERPCFKVHDLGVSPQEAQFSVIKTQFSRGFAGTHDNRADHGKVYRWSVPKGRLRQIFVHCRIRRSLRQRGPLATNQMQVNLLIAVSMNIRCEP